ncbi:hypothetical protein ADUPG1_000182 [Aduncisulcus paluster]|uniref:Protein kinase domain-containing protein n=1 Tax=Aduncisulcus paluster TaxID=2918883 RepID=A0ABQ5K5C4_9EUKA|nr:hypothetical protein ADUPG1_000182 [Aduncisulcus paluster]
MGRDFILGLSSKSKRKKEESLRAIHSLRSGNEFTLTSLAGVESKCLLGKGGFGEISLVKIAQLPQLCVLKKMLSAADEMVVASCYGEFKIQHRLFMNHRCFHRIPRPLYVLDCLDADFTGVYGFLMEFCAGGSVSAFAKTWCVDVKDESADEGEEDYESSSDSDVFARDFDPLTLNPVKVASLCVGMIECLADVFKASRRLVHRDIKPENFLVRVNPTDGECNIVLADLGLAKIKHSISISSNSVSFSSVSSISADPMDSGVLSEAESSPQSYAGTFAYSSCETIKFGESTQLSDAHSLGMSILALFLCKHPFIGHPLFQSSQSISLKCMKYIYNMPELLKSGMVEGMLTRSRLFRSLETIEDGKFKPVLHCLNEVFQGLTRCDVEERMDVHTAREKVQLIKDLLPKIGEGWECPTEEEIIRMKIEQYGKSR